MSQPRNFRGEWTKFNRTATLRIINSLIAGIAITAILDIIIN